MEQQLQNLPVGVQDFEKLRRGNYRYVDKTALIYKLVNEGCCYFLSRPRRFGKSLLLSTLEAYFLGRKDLFHGTAIENLENDWDVYPVLHLDLNTAKFYEPGTLSDKLNTSLTQWEKIYNTDCPSKDFGIRFEYVIQRAFEKTGKQVVILVDEYDKPLLETINNQVLQDDYRATLKGFYGALKSMDACIKFAMLTGVTKFGKVSIFSDLNNLDDISLDSDYFNICGIDEQELHCQLDPYVQRLASKNHFSVDEAYEQLKLYYDGYHFTEDTPGMYNPFSLLSALKKRKIGHYWFDTGTPTYLVDMIRKKDYNLEELSQDEVSADVLSSIDLASENPIPVIYQSGYLTIKGYDHEFEIYKLGFPNKEVKSGFLRYLMPSYMSLSNKDAGFQVNSFVSEIRRGDTDAFMDRLKGFFANTPYELIQNLENHYQNVLFILCTLCGLYTKAEYHTCAGRIDMTIETDRFVYVFEFKLNRSVREALAQIRDNNYAESFASSGKQVICIGANFSDKVRNLDSYQAVSPSELQGMDLSPKKSARRSTRKR